MPNKRRHLSKKEQKNVDSLLNAYNQLSDELKLTVGQELMDKINAIYDSNKKVQDEEDNDKTIEIKDKENKDKKVIKPKRTIYDYINLSKEQANVVAIVSIALLGIALIGMIIYALVKK